MNIGSLSSLSGIQQQNIQKTDAKLQAVIASLVSGRKAQDVADLAIATELQSATAGLKQVSQNLAQVSSLTQVADGAIASAQDIVGRLQELAVQSKNGTLSNENRSKLNEEFQALTKELDRVVAKTQFNGQNLLDGTLKGNNSLSLNRALSTDSDGDDTLEIDNLASSVLFGGQSLDVLSADGADKALNALSGAANTISSARASVGAFQQRISYAAASVDSAIINQEAARAELSDTDFLDAITQSQQAQVQHNAQLSLLAQGNRLPAALLQLVA